jgi:hypothetical protein
VPLDSGGHDYGETINIRTYCKLNGHDSADPTQGPFIMAELLTRHSDILGFRLDMSRAEIEAADDVLHIGAPPATERCFETPRTSAAISSSCFAVSCFAVDAGFACPFERSRQPTIFSAS